MIVLGHAARLKPEARYACVDEYFLGVVRMAGVPAPIPTLHSHLLRLCSPQRAQHPDTPTHGAGGRQRHEAPEERVPLPEVAVCRRAEGPRLTALPVERDGGPRARGRGESGCKPWVPTMLASRLNLPGAVNIDFVQAGRSVVAVLFCL